MGVSPGFGLFRATSRERGVNNWTKPSDPAKVTVRLKDKRGAAVKTTGEATMTTLQSLDGRAANPPGQPALISPRRRVLPSFADGSVLHIPSNSYVVVEATLAEGIQAGAAWIK